MKSIKGLKQEEIRHSNTYCSQCGADYMVENLAWSTDCNIKTCEEPLWNKATEGLAGMFLLESGGFGTQD